MSPIKTALKRLSHDNKLLKYTKYHYINLLITSSTRPASPSFFHALLVATAMIPAYELKSESPEALADKYGVSIDEIDKLRNPRPPATVPLHEIAAKPLPTGTPFDGLLRGVYKRRLTEICGAAGTGKTTFCHCVALAAQQDDPRRVLFITSEPSIILRRLHSLQPQFPDSDLERVLMLPKPFSTGAALLNLLQGDELLQLIEDTSVLIVDTLPRLQVDEVVHLTRHLRALAIKHDVAVILTNGIVGTPQQPPDYIEGVRWSQESPHIMGNKPHVEWADVPRLGWPLARNVDTRILLTRVNNKRHFRILYSADTGPCNVQYEILSHGFELVAET